MTEPTLVATLDRSGVWSLHEFVHEDVVGVLTVTAAEWAMLAHRPRRICCGRFR